MKVIYPGSFDPPTLGHADVFERAGECFDEVVVAVMVNPAKKGRFDLETRIEIIEEMTKEFKNVSVVADDGMLGQLVQKLGCDGILRGIRNINDFESERDRAVCNNKLYGVETVFLFSRGEHAHISSSLVSEILHFGGDVSGFVPKCVLDKILGGKCK